MTTPPLIGTGQLARAPGETVSGGPYAITQGTLAANSNYTIAFTAGTLAITPATLTVTAKPETKVFGSADPALAYTASGFQFDDTAATVLSGHLSRAAGQTVAGGPYTITQGTLAADGNYTIQFKAGTLTITPATPFVSVHAPGGVYTGSPIAVRATVAGSNGTPAANLEDVTPVLTYYAGSGTSETSLGSTPPIDPGTYTVVAMFPGSADYVASQSLPVTFTIGKAAPGITLVPSVGASVFGQTVTLLANISFGAATPGGSVTFYAGSTPIGAVPVNASGQAALTTAALGIGTQSLTASYGGDADFSAGVSSVSAESVSQAATQVALVPQPVFRNKRKLVSLGLKARVQPTAPASGVPTGSVTFEIQKKVGKKLTEKVLGTVALSGGSATLSVKPGVVLDKLITVLYSGASDFTASIAAPSLLTTKALDRMAQPSATPRSSRHH